MGLQVLGKAAVILTPMGVGLGLAGVRNTANSQVAATKCQVEGAFTSNGLVCTKGPGKGSLWRVVKAPVPDPCKLHDNAKLLAASLALRDSQLRILAASSNSRDCHVGDGLYYFASFAVSQPKTPLYNAGVYDLIPNASVPRTAASGRTVYVVMPSYRRIVVWTLRSPGVYSGIVGDVQAMTPEIESMLVEEVGRIQPFIL